MPVDANRFGTPEQQGERLPGDHEGPIAWVCPSCGSPNVGRPEEGCPVCGAGKPGEIAKGRQPAFEELQAPLGTVPPLVPKVSSSLAERIVASTGGTRVTLDEIRQVVREELQSVLTAPQPAYTEQERYAILEGIRTMQLFGQQQGGFGDDAEKFPTLEQLAGLYQRIADGGQ